MTEKKLDINDELLRSWVENHRPPIEVRDQLDWGYTYDRNVIEIFEIRPMWRQEDEFQQFSFAKIRYVKSQK